MKLIGYYFENIFQFWNGVQYKFSASNPMDHLKSDLAGIPTTMSEHFRVLLFMEINCPLTYILVLMKKYTWQTLIFI